MILKDGRNFVSYRSRWIFEWVFQSMKRIFGDHVSPRKFDNAIMNLMIKASLYNMFIGMNFNNATEQNSEKP